LPTDELREMRRRSLQALGVLGGLLMAALLVVLLNEPIETPANGPRGTTLEVAQSTP
jgi:hypothetical protein